MATTHLQHRIRLQQLRLLVGIADLGSLQAAAQQIHISQPAATKALKQFESSVGDTLVTRGSMGSVLTAVGQVLCRHARLILSELRDIDEELQRFHNGSVGQLVVGGMPVATSMLLPLAIETLMSEFPDITVRVIEGSSDNLFPRLREGSLDMLVGRFWPGNEPDMVSDFLYDSSFALAVRKGHPLFKQKKLTLQSLMHLPWILPPPGAYSRTALDDMFRHAGLALPASPVETTSYSVIRSLLINTDAICPMPIETLHRDVQAGSIKLLPMRLELRLPPVGIVRLRHRSLSPASEIFIRHLQMAGQATAQGLSH